MLAKNAEVQILNIFKATEKRKRFLYARKNGTKADENVYCVFILRNHWF